MRLRSASDLLLDIAERRLTLLCRIKELISIYHHHTPKKKKKNPKCITSTISFSNSTCYIAVSQLYVLILYSRIGQCARHQKKPKPSWRILNRNQSLEFPYHLKGQSCTAKKEMIIIIRNKNDIKYWISQLTTFKYCN